METAREIKIPKMRIAVLIGREGETKKEIEHRTKTRIEVDKEGDVTILGKSIDIMVSEQIVKAIARGFSPENALTLVNEDYMLDVMDIKEYCSTDNAMTRLKGRVIGKKGESRNNLEKLTATKISVFGKTVSILGRTENVINARNAIDMLLSGARHATVYAYVEKANKKMRTML